MPNEQLNLLSGFMSDYQRLAQRTSNAEHDRVLNGAMGLVGETGEIVDLVKKWRFQSGENAELPEAKLIEECGDVLWYCAELAQGMNLELFSLYREGEYLMAQDGTAFSQVVEPWAQLSIEEAVLSMSALASSIGAPENDDIHIIAGVLLALMTAIDQFLIKHCNSSIKQAMEYNIAKLRARYPDGFDAERSLHRDGEAPFEAIISEESDSKGV